MFRHVRELVTRHPSFLHVHVRRRRLHPSEDAGNRRPRSNASFQLPVASHLTCVGSTVEQLRDYLTRAVEAGVDYIVALRGDPPAGETSFQPPPGGLRYANELVSLIKAEFPHLGIAVAGYPETHREAPSPEADLQNLRRKVDAGADIIVTQLFYNNDDFFRFRDRCTAVRHHGADHTWHPACQ